MLELEWRRRELRGKTLWVLHAPGFSCRLRADGGIGHVAHERKHRYRCEVGLDETRFWWTETASMVAALNAVERHLEKVSIGWFGVDNLTFRVG